MQITRDRIITLIVEVSGWLSFSDLRSGGSSLGDMGKKVSFFSSHTTTTISTGKNEVVGSLRINNKGKAMLRYRVDLLLPPINPRECEGLGIPDCDRCTINMVRQGCVHLKRNRPLKRRRGGKLKNYV